MGKRPEYLREALEQVPAPKKLDARRDAGIAEICYLHFRSVANQIHSYLLREQWMKAPAEERAGLGTEMAAIVRGEIDLARRLYEVLKLDSTIGFEISNHYYYRPLDLVEKVLNCTQVLRELGSG